MSLNAEKIYHENEVKYRRINYDKFNKFIEDFYHSIGMELDSLMPEEIDKSDSTQRFHYIKYLVLTYLSKYCAEFYKLLEDSGYQMESEIIDSLKLLGKEENIFYAGDIIQYVLRNPLVQEVKVDGVNITLNSDRFGTFKVVGARNYLKDNLNAYSLFTYGDVSHRCHQLSTTLLHEIEDMSLVTSLMPSYFEGTYYHSYLKDDNGIIIDGSNQLVMDELAYDRLFKPCKIISSKRYELYDEYVDAIKSKRIYEVDGFYIPLAVALSKQLKLGGK